MRTLICLLFFLTPFVVLAKVDTTYAVKDSIVTQMITKTTTTVLHRNSFKNTTNYHFLETEVNSLMNGETVEKKLETKLKSFFPVSLDVSYEKIAVKNGQTIIEPQEIKEEHLGFWLTALFTLLPLCSTLLVFLLAQYRNGKLSHLVWVLPIYLLCLVAVSSLFFGLQSIFSFPEWIAGIIIVLFFGYQGLSWAGTIGQEQFDDGRIVPGVILFFCRFWRYDWVRGIFFGFRYSWRFPKFTTIWSINSVCISSFMLDTLDYHKDQTRKTTGCRSKISSLRFNKTPLRRCFCFTNLFLVYSHLQK